MRSIKIDLSSWGQAVKIWYNTHHMKDLKAAYRTIEADHFAPQMEISFIDGDKRSTLRYEKVAWNIGGEEKGLRYGENPGQEAALYKLVNGNLVLGDVELLQPGQYLASVPELLQSGKHPGKTNVTDTDNALNILRYLMDKPTAVIVKHNNPCGVATGSTLAEAYFRANKADRLAAFGGAIALNRDCDLETAKLVVENYAEVVVAPDFAPGVMDLFATKKNLRVFRIRNMSRLTDFVAKHVIDFKSLIDGGIVAQTSFSANARRPEDFMPAYCNRKITDKATGEVRYEEHKIARLPTAKEYEATSRTARRSASAPASRTASASPRSRATRRTPSTPTGSRGKSTSCRSTTSGSSSARTTAPRSRPRSWSRRRPRRAVSPVARWSPTRSSRSATASRSASARASPRWCSPAAPSATGT